MIMANTADLTRVASDSARLHAARSGSSVLVVDDEAVVREFLARCLERSGYIVKQAESAAQALETMMTAPASAVLCDIRMPGQDGLWLAEQLHARWPHTPVVMATAIDDVQTVRQTRDLGAVDYISKPIKPDQLVEVVDRAVAAGQGNASPEQQLEADAAQEMAPSAEERIEVEYTLESPVRCPACGERIVTLKAIRLVRTQVNFTSTLPRRGRVIACPICLAVVPAELSNF
jgi:CheY-like chemotaxis protein